MTTIEERIWEILDGHFEDYTMPSPKGEVSMFDVCTEQLISLITNEKIAEYKALLNKAVHKGIGVFGYAETFVYADVIEDRIVELKDQRRDK